jgi:outer membrane immunogenic protein
MQKTLVAATLAAVLGMGGAAYAADIYAGGGLKDAPVYAPATSWTGFYAGIGVGGGAVNHDGTASFGGLSGELNGIGGEGALGTVQVGYDYQLDHHFVVGVFADFDFTDITSSARISLGGTSLSASGDLNDMWSVGGRVGYLVNSNTLAYVLASYTEADFSFPHPLTNSTFSGYSVGGGLETRLGGNWFLKGEYRFTQLDQQTVLTAFAGHLRVTDQPDVQTGRVSLVYKLGQGYEPLK